MIWVKGLTRKSISSTHQPNKIAILSVAHFIDDSVVLIAVFRRYFLLYLIVGIYFFAKFSTAFVLKGEEKKEKENRWTFETFLPITISNRDFLYVPLKK